MRKNLRSLAILAIECDDTKSLFINLCAEQQSRWKTLQTL